MCECWRVILPERQKEALDSREREREREKRERMTRPSTREIEKGEGKK